MDDCLFWELCVFRYRSPRRADHPSREVLLSVVCLNVIVKPGHRRAPGLLGTVTPYKNLLLVWREDLKSFWQSLIISALGSLAFWHYATFSRPPAPHFTSKVLLRFQMKRIQFIYLCVSSSLFTRNPRVV